MKKPKNKIEEISRNVLGRYFVIDGKRVTADLYFDTFEELIDQNIGNDSVEKLNGVLFDKLNEVFSLIPRKYDIDVKLHIKNLGDYALEETEKIIKDNVALMSYAFELNLRRKRITGLSLLAGGCAMLAVSYFLSKLDWPQIIFDVINISGTLLVWEAADISLIERNLETKRAKQYIKKFKSISVLNDR
ncbi:MAG: hypothetical protein NC099_05125 [Corallococcus sp.]|nr:hypothetical protein [Bacillota bacterium]MCM1534016.1 hypothetical protein [Corallococcus sp.]